MSAAPVIQNEPERIDLDSPRWDQSTFSGRFKHFAGITNMLLSLKSDKELNDAQNLLNLYRFMSLEFILLCDIWLMLLGQILVVLIT